MYYLFPFSLSFSFFFLKISFHHPNQIPTSFRLPFYLLTPPISVFMNSIFLNWLFFIHFSFPVCILHFLFYYFFFHSQINHSFQFRFLKYLFFFFIFHFIFSFLIAITISYFYIHFSYFLFYTFLSHFS